MSKSNNSNHQPSRLADTTTGELGEWYPVVSRRHVPFGYKQDEEDPDLLLPIPEELELLEKLNYFFKSTVLGK